jgi:inner membrane protein
VDVLSFVGGSYFALAFRRGITHGVPALVVMPFLVAGCVLAYDRWGRARRDPNRARARPGAVLALATLGLLTHPVLDWMNVYGVRWWLPFAGPWSYGDALFIVDPWLWLMLGGTVFLSGRHQRRATVAWGALAAATSALVFVGAGPDVFAPWALGIAAVAFARARRWPTRPWSRLAVMVTLAASAVYVSGMVGAQRSAASAVRAAAVGAGLDVRDVMVSPVAGRPARSDIVVVTDAAYVPGAHSFLGSPRVRLEAGAAVPLLSAPDGLSADRVDAIVAAARARPVAEDFLVWSRYPYVRVSGSAEGWHVRFADARYDDRPETGALSGITVIVGDAESDG